MYAENGLIPTFLWSARRRALFVPVFPWDIMRTESIVSAVFALGTAASAWFGWPFALTAGCAVVSAVFALIAGRKD